jgi:hypothetical protein
MQEEMIEKHYKATISDGVWVAEGPYVGGGVMGTVPKFTRSMTADDAEYLANLLDRAYAAGQDNVRDALGI